MGRSFAAIEYDCVSRINASEIVYRDTAFQFCADSRQIRYPRRWAGPLAVSRVLFQPSASSHLRAVFEKTNNDDCDCVGDNVVEYIDSMPLANTPEVFGLHPNAEIGYYTTAAKDMWSHMIDLQPQIGKSDTHTHTYTDRERKLIRTSIRRLLCSANYYAY